MEQAWFRPQWNIPLLFIAYIEKKTYPYDYIVPFYDECIGIIELVLLLTK